MSGKVNTNRANKKPKVIADRSLKIPTQPAGPGAPLAAPSVLHLIQLQIGGVQST